MQRFLVGLIAVLALGVVGMALVLNSGRETPKETALSIYSGVEQSGTRLGASGAPVTVGVFLDTQCPACARFEREALPGIIDRYVRTGKAKLELVAIDFLGADSRRGAQAVYAASSQGKAWQVAALLLDGRGARNSGYVTDSYLSALAMKAGASPSSLLGALPGELPRVQAATARARNLGIEATPSFLVRVPGREERIIKYSSPRASELSRAIEGR